MVERPEPPHIRPHAAQPSVPHQGHEGVDDVPVGARAADVEPCASGRAAALSPPPRRVIHRAQRWTPMEWAHIRARAWACGMTPSRFVREAALGARPSPRHDAQQSRAIYELGRIGTDLRVLLKRVDPSSNAASDDALHAFHRAVLVAIAGLKIRRAPRGAE